MRSRRPVSECEEEAADKERDVVILQNGVEVGNAIETEGGVGAVDNRRVRWVPNDLKHDDVQRLGEDDAGGVHGR